MGSELTTWNEDSWYETTWGEIVELKYGKSLKDYKNSTGKYQVFGTNGPVGWCDKALCDHPSVIIGRKGAYRGVHYSNAPFFVIDTAFYIKPLANINLKWAYYFLLTMDINGLDSGSAIPSTRREDFYALPAKIPPREIQDSIVESLDSFNNKIQLNRQTNQTLEAMAQALFKSWFVDFDPVIDNALDAGKPIPEPLQKRADRRRALRQSPDAPAPLPAEIRALFPDGFVLDQEMGWIPEGWEVQKLEGVTDLIIDHRGKTPKKLGGDWSETGYPAISAKNIKSGQIVRHDTIRFVDKALYDKWMKAPLKPGDIALTSEAPLGELFYFAEKHDYLLSQRLYGLRASSDNCSGSYLYFWLKTEQAWSDMEGRATGTTVVGIRQSELRQVDVLLPPRNIISAFSDAADQYLKRIELGNTQNSQLEGIRDTLLPKLISGELRLPEAEQQVAAATG